jgi:dolichyl-phosphate-mannose--protein O-mannosyl transferase
VPRLPAVVRDRHLLGWAGPLGLAVLAFVLRVWDLGRPNRLMFDETYYAKDAYSLLHHGYVRDWAEDANDGFVRGDFSGLGELPTQIVHPDGGKWMLALGQWAFGTDSFGWRISAAVAGALTVLVLARLVLRLTGSLVASGVAGLLLALDGVHLVLSRVALLDVFLCLWIVVAVACLVADRDWIDARLDRFHAWRPWQVAAGVSLGLACSVKWSGVYVLAVAGLAIVLGEVAARRRAWRAGPALGPRPGLLLTTLRVGAPAFVTLVGLALVVYLLSWTGWLVHHEAYELRFGRGYGDAAPWGSYVGQEPGSWWAEAWNALRSLWHFHVMAYDFHTGDYLAEQTHPYQSHPLGWLVLERPVGVDAQNDLPAATCGAAADSSCMREVLVLGNPAVWWAGVLALVASLVTWVRTRRWTWSVPVLGLLASWVPWFLSTDRPIFLFYAVAILPFTIIAIALVVDALRRRLRGRARLALHVVLGLYLVTVVVLFVYFHPIWTDALISYDQWRSRMWFPRWI